MTTITDQKEQQPIGLDQKTYVRNIELELAKIELENRILKEALKRALRSGSGDVNLNAHALARHADRVAQMADADREAVLGVLRSIYSEVVFEAFDKAKDAHFGGGHG